MRNQILNTNVNSETYINSADMSYTRPSPCKGCLREFKSKDVCVSLCERMGAYRKDLPYEHLPFVSDDDVLNAMPKNARIHEECLIEGCEREGLDRELCASHGAAWRLGRIAHPKLGWWSNDKEVLFVPSVKEKCVFDCPNEAKVRGCCYKHYHVWIKGRIKHPDYGVFKKAVRAKRGPYGPRKRAE